MTQLLSFSLFMVGWRFLIVWIYKNTGKSLPTPSLFHTMRNIIMFGVLLSVFNIEAVGSLSVFILGVVTIITALIVIFLWDPGLNKCRWSR